MYVEKELKKEIIQIRDFLLSLVAALPAGVIAIDLKGIVIAVNQKALNLLGKQEKRISEIIDKDIFSIIAGLPDLEKELQKCIRHRRSKIFIPELHIVKEGNDVFLAVIGKPISQGMLIFLEDITRIKAVERMKAEFISIVSHQLGTPLVGIRWAIERIFKKEKLTIGLQGYLQDIHVSVQRLSGLVSELLNTSRFEEGRLVISPKKIELVAFIRDYIVECTPLFIKKGVALTFEEHPKTLNVITDSNILRNVIQSLVSNAIEYTPEGGKVKVFLERKDGYFLFTVSDTGIGIPKEEQANIFKKFSRANNAKLIKPSGAGLGLYLGKQAVEILGGKIWLKSQENKGTTFYVELPLKSRSKKGSKSLA